MPEYLASTRVSMKYIVFYHDTHTHTPPFTTLPRRHQPREEEETAARSAPIIDGRFGGFLESP